MQNLYKLLSTEASTSSRLITKLLPILNYCLNLPVNLETTSHLETFDTNFSCFASSSILADETESLNLNAENLENQHHFIINKSESIPELWLNILKLIIPHVKLDIAQRTRSAI